MPGNLKATATSGTTVRLSWTASSDNVSVAGYRVSRDGNQIGTTTSTTFNDSGLSAQTLYGYSVQAYDAQNNLSDPATTSVSTPGIDTQPPTAPGTLTFTKRSGRVTLKWGAATDNVAVGGYRVYRNGALLATLGASTLTYQNRPPRGSVSYFVVAFDTSNLVGPASNTVTLVAR
jgi:chitodextrinase